MNITKLCYVLRSVQVIDVGEPAMVPDDFSDMELQSGVWWRHLVAGAAAGSVSRTCTAPLDRMKLMLMVGCILYALQIMLEPHRSFDIIMD